jgi:O-antigen/teichoic acid export membrane protein
MSQFSRGIAAFLIVCLRKIRQVQNSTLMREGIWITVINIVAKAINFFASAFAVSCVGAVNFGTSGVIFTLAAQSSLLFNGGFDAVVSRDIAREKAQHTQLVSIVTTFRIAVWAAISLLWISMTWYFVPHEQWGVWQLGILVMLSNALNLVYVFQGLGKLPLLNLIMAAGSLVTATAYFLFVPQMPLGADLAVAASVSALTVFASWTGYFKSASGFPQWRFDLYRISQLFRVSWRYWIISAAQYLYTTAQILIVAYIVSAQETGVYRSAMLVSSSLDVVFSSFYNLLLPRFMAWRNISDAYFRSQRRKMFWLFCVVGVVPVLTTALAASWIYKTFFSATFAGGAEPLVFLVVAKFVNFIGQLYSYSLIVYKQDDESLIGCLTGSLISIIASFIFVGYFGIVAAALATLLGECVITMLYIFFSRRAESPASMQNAL